MPRQKIHLVGEDVAVAKNQVFRLVRHIRRIEKLHAGLFWRAPAFPLIAGTTGGDHVHPRIAPALRNRRDMVARQAGAGQAVATIGADMAVAMEQLAVVERRHLAELTPGQRAALDGDDAVRTDFRLLPGQPAEAAMDGEAVISRRPGHQVLGVIKAGMLPSHPAVRRAMRVKREDQGVGAHGFDWPDCIRLTISPEAYQSILTMESSSWQQEKTRNFRGFPLRPMLLSLLLHTLVLLGLAPQFSPVEFSVPPIIVLHGELLPALPPDSAVTNEVAIEPVVHAQRELPPVPILATPSNLVREIIAEPAQKPRADPAQTQPVAVNAVQPVPQGFPSVTPTMAQPSVPNKSLATSSEAPGGIVSRTTAGPATVAVAKELSDRGANAAGLRQFRVALAGEARRFRRYPETARREGLTGTAEVRVTIETGLPARRVDLSRSSGHLVLDAAAVEMLRQAVTRVELPETLRGQNFAVLLPVVFEVED